MSQIVKSTPFPRVLWQFCLCRSAGESIPASHQVLRQVQMQGAGQRPHPCSGVATASCLTSVSPFVITRTLFAKRVHLNNSSFKNNSFFYFCSLKSTAWQWCVLSICSMQYPDVMFFPEEGVCCVSRGWQGVRIQIILPLKAAATVQSAPASSFWLLTVPPPTTRGSSNTHLKLVCFLSGLYTNV